MFTLFCACCNHQDNLSSNGNDYENLNAKFDDRKVSYNDIQKWCYDDTLHNKIFFFFNDACCGCLHELKRNEKLISTIDTSKWKIFYLTTYSDADAQINLDNILQHTKRYGINKDNLYIWIDGYEVPDSTNFKKITSQFKSHHPIGAIQGIPTTFIVDKHGYLAIIKTYDSFEKTQFQYNPCRLSSQILEDVDFSKDNGESCIEITTRQ